jgi:hypothetical protein
MPNSSSEEEEELPWLVDIPNAFSVEEEELPWLVDMPNAFSLEEEELPWLVDMPNAFSLEQELPWLVYSEIRAFFFFRLATVPHLADICWMSKEIINHIENKSSSGLQMLRSSLVLLMPMFLLPGGAFLQGNSESGGKSIR